MDKLCENWSSWLKKTRFSYMNKEQVEQTLNWLLAVRDTVIAMAEIKEGQKIADFGCGSGLLGFGILEKYGDKVELIFSDKFQDCLDECKKILESSDTSSNVKFLQSDVSDIKLENEYLDKAMTRSVLVHIKDKFPVFSELQRVLKPGGYYCAFEPIISENTRYYELLSSDVISNYDDFKKAEMEFMTNPNDPLVNFSAESLDKDLEAAGFSNVAINVNIAQSKYIALSDTIKSWFITPPGPGQKSVKERFLLYFDEARVDNFIQEVVAALSNKEVEINTRTALIKAIK